MRDPHRAALREASGFRRAGDAPAAIDLLAEILEAEPAHATANVEMARALRLIDDPAEAESYYRTAIEDVLDYSLVVELAECLVEQGRVIEAEELLDAALQMAEGRPRLDPGEALCVRATIALAQGRHEDARAALSLIVAKRASDRTRFLRARLEADLDEAAPATDA